MGVTYTGFSGPSNAPSSSRVSSVPVLMLIRYLEAVAWRRKGGRVGARVCVCVYVIGGRVGEWVSGRKSPTLAQHSGRTRADHNEPSIVII